MVILLSCIIATRKESFMVTNAQSEVTVNDHVISDVDRIPYTKIRGNVLDCCKQLCIAWLAIFEQKL